MLSDADNRMSYGTLDGIEKQPSRSVQFWRQEREERQNDAFCG
jgi:hypothetical protein